MREINVEQLEECARALESEVASAGLLRLLLGDSTGAATPGRYRFLHEAIDERPALRRSLLDGKVKTIRSEWAQALADRQSDARFLHGLAVLYREKALAGLANGNAEPHHWVIGTALWSLLLCSDKFWHYFSQARSTSRETVERSDLGLEKQEALLEESLHGILSLHSTQGSRNFAANRYDQAVVHLRCLAICQDGRDVLLAALEEQGFHFKLAFDEARLERLQTTASELLDDWCATLVREADKAAEDAEAFKRLPKGIQKNYEGGIKKLEPFINLNIPVKRVLRASLEWYNAWCYDLYLTHDPERIQELMKPACAVADQLVALCIKLRGHTPENQSLSMHFLLRGFTCGDPEQAINEYREALAWNPANENAQKLLGESAQAVLMEQLNTAIECMEQKKFTEAYEVLDSVEERATEKDEIQKARAIVCFHHGNALANDGKFRQALERGLEAQRLERDQEVIDEFVKTMEELAPEEDNLRHLRGAQEAFGEERYDQCITKARKVSARSNYLSDAHRLQSAAHFHIAIQAAEKNDLPKAEKEIRKSLELNDDPEEREIISQQLEIIVEGENVRCLNEAHVAMEADKFDDCINSAAKVPSKSKYAGDARHMQSLGYFRRGIEAAKKDLFDQAEADLKRSLELDDDAEERRTIQEQIEALGHAKTGGELKQAFDAENWTKAEKILREALKDKMPKDVKRQIESQLSVVLNLKAVEEVKDAQEAERKFGEAIGRILSSVKELQNEYDYQSSYAYKALCIDTRCPVCDSFLGLGDSSFDFSPTSWGVEPTGKSHKAKIVSKVMDDLRRQGSFSVTNLQQFWRPYKDELCMMCGWKVDSLGEGSRRDAVKILQEAVKLDSSNKSAKENLAALKKSL